MIYGNEILVAFQQDRHTHAYIANYRVEYVDKEERQKWKEFCFDSAKKTFWFII